MGAILVQNGIILCLKWVSKMGIQVQEMTIHSHFLHQKSAINTCSLHKYGTSYYGGLQDPKEPFPAQEMIKCGQLSAGNDYKGWGKKNQ